MKCSVLAWVSLPSLPLLFPPLSNIDTDNICKRRLRGQYGSSFNIGNIKTSTLKLFLHPKDFFEFIYWYIKLNGMFISSECTIFFFCFMIQNCTKWEWQDHLKIRNQICCANSKSHKVSSFNVYFFYLQNNISLDIRKYHLNNITEKGQIIVPD